MKTALRLGLVIGLLLGLTFQVAAVTTISGPTYLDPGATGSYSVSEAATIRFPKYLTGGSSVCSYGPNTTTYRVFQCPAGGAFSVVASLTPGSFVISAGSYNYVGPGATWTSTGFLSVQVGPAPTPTPLPTPIPTPAPTPTPTVTITDLGGGTYQFSSPNPIDVRFSRYASIVASDCPVHNFYHWGQKYRLGVTCSGGTTYNLTLIFPAGTWTITANDGTYASLTLVVP